MTDAEIIELYRRWGEETYCAGFMKPDALSVAQFRAWLTKAAWTPDTAEPYELAMLAEYHRQEAQEVE